MVKKDSYLHLSRDGGIGQWLMPKYLRQGRHVGMIRIR